MGCVEKRAIVCLKCLKFNTQNNVVLLSEISFGSCTNHHYSHMHMSDGELISARWYQFTVN